VLSLFVLACYGAAAWCLIASMRAAPGAGRRAAGLFVGALAVVAHAWLLWQGIAGRSDLALTAAETASLVGFGIAVISLLVCAAKARFAGASALLLIAAGLVAAVTNEGARHFAVGSSGWELKVHIVLSVLAYALLAVGTALAIALTMLDRRLRTHQPLGWLAIFPAVAALESAMFNALATGFAVLSLSLFSGFFFVQDMFAQSLSRKVALSCLAWLILAVLLFGRWRFGWRGRTARNWIMGGFGVLCLAYFGSKLVLETVLGRHWG
jgi:ABC-type uncharacterized transport system permease subunit